jgi:hypothetical protein
VDIGQIAVLAEQTGQHESQHRRMPDRRWQGPLRAELGLSASKGPAWGPSRLLECSNGVSMRRTASRDQGHCLVRAVTPASAPLGP